MARASTTVQQPEDILKGDQKSEATGDLQAQIARLKEDIAGLASAIADLGSEKMHKAKRGAAETYESAYRSGEDAVTELRDQLAETARERPLTTIAAAAGVGFLLALLARR
ncbi:MULTISPECIES: YqjD family protein [Phyllobacteriaceae]|uniref:DUF883 domain-containing protein n=1 Tax=Phyllobacterium phragmitis TaxID=2670329 RepID=A0ABQ0H2N8_9HYPH|nr:DUF883 C-terminal domain-containing protein [Mesorhizobium sp. RMAD-H1]MBB2973573.1 ElaB/YqjD/DUF883 family membrane-anchored ribosome-binding protein [Mesorhizobium sp. RMAD-H1]